MNALLLLLLPLFSGPAIYLPNDISLVGGVPSLELHDMMWNQTCSYCGGCITLSPIEDRDLPDGVTMEVINNTTPIFFGICHWTVLIPKSPEQCVQALGCSAVLCVRIYGDEVTCADYENTSPHYAHGFFNEISPGFFQATYQITADCGGYTISTISVCINDEWIDIDEIRIACTECVGTVDPEDPLVALKMKVDEFYNFTPFKYMM